jgi:hypothetical protein
MRRLVYAALVRPLRLGLVTCLAVAAALGCGSPTSPTAAITFTTDFRGGMQGWQFGVAHAVAGCVGTPPMAISELRTFGSPLQSSGSGLYLQAKCYSVFAFVKKSVTGLRPRESYRVTTTVEIATDTPPTPCIPQGNPNGFSGRNAFGTAVYAAGVSREPKLVPAGDGVELDGGLMLSGYLADISTSEKRCGPTGPAPIWEFRSHSGGGMPAAADATGGAWLIAGLLSDNAAIYLSKVSVTFTPDSAGGNAR